MISLSRTPTRILHPREHDGQTVSVNDISQLRALKRKSRLVSAPTGQMSMTFIEYGLSNCVPGKGEIVTWSPRSTNVSTGCSAISSPKRIQREHEMQRSPSKSTFGPKGTRLSL